MIWPTLDTPAPPLSDTFISDIDTEVKHLHQYCYDHYNLLADPLWNDAEFPSDGSPIPYRNNAIRYPLGPNTEAYWREYTITDTDTGTYLAGICHYPVDRDEAIQVIASLIYTLKTSYGDEYSFSILELIKEYEAISHLSEILYQPCDNQAGAHLAGYIYLLEAEETGSYKIGRAKDLDNRIKTFEVKLPFETELRHSIKVQDMACAELALHKKFAGRRINGEWFKLTPEDVSWICSL